MSFDKLAKNEGSIKLQLDQSGKIAHLLSIEILIKEKNPSKRDDPTNGSSEISVKVKSR